MRRRPRQARPIAISRTVNPQRQAVTRYLIAGGIATLACILAMLVSWPAMPHGL